LPDRAVWQPPSGVCAHDGSPLPLDLDFFAAPPREIGKVRTAYSTLKRGAPAGTLVLKGTIIGACLFFSFCGAMMMNKSDSVTLGVVLITSLGGIIGVAIALLGTKSHQCQFVGEDGVAYFDWTSSGAAPSSLKTMLEFKDATTLRTFLMETIQNGVSQGTQYTFTWEREDPLPSFKYNGMFRNLRTLAASDHYQFALEAERAWTDFKMPIIQDEFREQGSVTFPLRPRGFIRLSREEIEIDDKRGEKAFRMAKIDSIKVKHGNLVIRRVGSKPGLFTSGKGVYTIPYDSLADGQLFLIVVNTLVEHASRRA
jgi:hypothetical protein